MTSKLNLVDAGNGAPTIVFLHYFGGSTKTWRPVIDFLKDRYRCIAFDLPGFGDSAAVEMPDYKVASSANAFANSLSDLSAGDFIIVAHSMGGKIALQFASQQPQGLRALILVAGSPPEPEPMTEEDRWNMIEMFGKADLTKAHLKKISHQPLSNEMLVELADDNLRTNQAAWNYWMKTASNENITGLMTNIKIPVTLIAGEYDKPLTLDYMETLRRKYFPQADVQQIKNAAHLIPVEAPEELAKLIVAVIAKS